MKKLISLACFALVAAPIVGQAPPVSNDLEQVQALMKEVQAQQNQLAENQVKIDAKLAELSEAIRLAKIYASRGGR
jgi:hypothetical protein